MLAAGALALGAVVAHYAVPHRHAPRVATQNAATRLAAPDFALPQPDGPDLRLSSYRGKVVLLDFWATWCDPCREEIPHLVELQQRYGDRGLQIIGISMDDDAGPVLTLTRKRKVNYPIVMGDQKLGTLYGGILGLPVTYLIDRNGMVSAKFKGESSLVNMESKIEILLNQKPSKALAR